MLKNKFTVGLPINKDQIDRLADLNRNLDKSVISEFHGALPENLEENTGLEHNINMDCDMTTDKFFDLVEYGMSKGIKFTYLLTNPKGFQVDLPNYEEVYKKLDKLIFTLRNLGCDSLKVTNPSVMAYLKSIAPDFKMYLSTIAGYKDISQFRNLKMFFPELTKIVMTTDSMKNIPLLKSIQDLGLDVVYMVNEGCIEGCPFRNGHYNIQLSKFQDTDLSALAHIEVSSYMKKCDMVRFGDFANYVIKSNIIYPHMIQEYNKLGVHDFKIAGRLAHLYKNNVQIDFIENYLGMVEDPESSLNKPALMFNRACWDYSKHRVRNSNCKEYDSLTVKDLLPFLPDIEYFKKHGNKCNSDCGSVCTYCNNKAKELKQFMKERKDA